ncbi:protein qui-1 isoform X2 [Daktulosphaira vitifoliae]|nr:protein qui-1 isoform X2 [Daktulosphaira vitifoliae]
MKMTEDAYEQLKDVAQELNLEWSIVESTYKRDSSSGHFILLNPDYNSSESVRIWSDINEKALAILQEASQELLSGGLMVDPQIFHSAVQHQTLHALDLDKEHMVVYSREFTGRRKYDSYPDETTISFKQLLKDTIPSDNLIELSVEWKPGGIDGEHPEHDMYLTIFQEAIMSKMQSMINNSIEKRPELNARNKTIQEVLKETIVHISHCKELIKLNPPNPNLDAVEKIKKMMSTSNKHGPIIVKGGLGSGKTSIITTIYQECKKWFDKNLLRIIRFSGVTPRASYNLELLRIICQQLTYLLQPNGICVPLDASFDPLYVSDWFQTLLRRFEEECRTQTLVLFIDDLHRLNPLDSDIVAGLSWLPTMLPFNVHIICTTLHTPDDLKMTPLQKERFKNSDFYFVLPDSNIETIKININNMLDNYEKSFGVNAITRLASYISVSEFGLTETELLELLMPTTGDFGSSLKLEDGNFNFSTFCTAKKTIMPLLFEKFMSGRILLCWRNKITFDVVRHRYLTSKTQQKFLHSDIANLFFSEFSKDESEAKTENSISKDGETIIHNDMTYSLRHVEESWIHLLKAGDNQRLKELTLCNFDFLLAAVRTISVSYLRSILEHARCYVLDRDVELVYYTVRKSSDVLTRDTLQLGAQIICWLRPVADSSKLMHRIIRCSVSWCDGFTDPLLVPHTSWLQPPLPLHIKCVNCGIPITYIAPTPSAQHVVVVPKEGDAQLWHTMGNIRVNTFQGHQKPIKCLSINKNPQLLVTGSEDRSVLVWDLNTYALVIKYTELESLVLSLCVATIFDGGNKELGVVLGCENNKILLFTLKGKMVKIIEYHKGPVTAVQLTSQDVLVTGSRDCTVCLWEMDTLDLLNTISLPGPLQMLDISIDSMFLLVLCEGNQLLLHALATGTLIHTLKGYCSKVMSIALAEDCQRAVVAGVDSRVYIYDIHSGDLDLVPISTSPHHKEVIAVKITNNDDFLVTAGDGKIAYWNFRKMGNAQVINKHPSSLSKKPHTMAITCLDISRDGTMAVTGGLDSLVNVWNLNVESLENVYHLNNNELHSTMHGHSAAITCLAIASNGLFAVSGSEDKLVLVWGLTVGNAVFTFSGHQSAITAVEVTSDSEKVVSSDKAGVIAVWLSDNGTLLNSVICPATHLSVTNNMKYLVSGDSHFSLHIWPLAVKNGGPWTEKWPVSHTEEITCFVITYDSLQIITGSKDMSLKVWQINGGKLSQVLVGHEDQVTCVAVAISDKSIVVSGSWDANLIIWDIHTGDDRHLLTGHLGHVTCVKLSGDGSLALSGSDDKRIIVWDTKRGVALTSLQLHLPILDLSMSTDVTRVVVHLYESQYLPITQLMNTPAQYVKVPVFINREPRSMAAKKPMRRMLIKEYSLDSYTWQRKYAHLTSSITRAAVDEKLRRFSVSASMEEISKQATNNSDNMGSQNLGPEQAALAQSQHFDQLIAEWNNKRSPSKSTSRQNVFLSKQNSKSSRQHSADDESHASDDYI